MSGVISFVFAGVLIQPVAAQPANDNFADAEVIATWGADGPILSGSLTNDTTDATSEPSEPNHGGFLPSSTVWYSWTAPKDGEVRLDTLSTTLDTIVAVYTGPALGTLRQVAANDDLFPFQQQNYSEDVIPFGPGIGFLTTYPYIQPFNGPSGVRFNAKAGTTYYFVVGAKLTGGGPVILGWAYNSAGVFRFATEDVDYTTGLPVFRCSEMEGLGDNESTFHTYYEYAVPGVAVTVTRLGGSSGRVLVDYITEELAVPIEPNIAAVPLFDYLPVQGTLVFDDHEMTKRIVIPISSFSFGLPELNRDFSVVLTNARIDTLETPDVSAPRIDGGYGRALVRIYDMDIDPDLTGNWVEDTNAPYGATFTGPTNVTLNFTRKAYRVPEDVNSYWTTVRIPVVRSGTNLGSQTIQYRIDNLLGNDRNVDELDNNLFPLQPGSDYATPTPADDDNGNNQVGIHGRSPDFVMEPNYAFAGGGSLTFPDRDFNTRFIEFTVTNDTLTEFNEDFVITLYRVERNAVILVGMVNQTTVTILFDDQDPPAGSVDQKHNPDYGTGMAPPISTSPPNIAHPGTDGAVYGMIVQSDNRTLIAGEFNTYNSFPRGRIARLNTDGTLDSTFTPGSGANNFIGAVAESPGGRFVIGGGFSSYSGTQRIRVARINFNGTLDTSFNPGLGPNGSVWAIATQPDGKVIIGGEFTSVGGSTRPYVARLNTNGTVDMTFDLGVNVPDGTVWSIALQNDGKIIIGGDFFNLGSNPAGGIARLNPDGSRDLSFNSGVGTDGFVYAIALQADNKILVGGDFTTFVGLPRNDLVRLNSNGSLDDTFDPGSTGSDGFINSIVLDGASIYAGGAFDSYNGTHRLSLVRLYGDGTVDTTFLDTAYNQFAGLPRSRFAGPKGTINAIGVQTDGKVMIAGSFDKVGGGQADPQVRPDAADANLLTEKKARDGMRNRSNVARLIGGVTPGPGNISLTAPEHTAQENGSALSVSLTRNNGTLGFLSANFEVEDGLAKSGVDYVYNAVPPFYLHSWELYLQGYQSSEPNASSRMRSDGLFGDNFLPTDIYGHTWYDYALGNLVITLNNDSVNQGDRNTMFRLSNPTAADQFFLGGENIPLGGALGFARAPFTIFDDDQAPGVIGFATANYVVNENVGTATITVIRTNGSHGQISCNYTTLALPGSTNATQNVDYTPRSGTIQFASGQLTNTLQFKIPITDDTIVEPDEVIVIRLYGPVQGGASLGLTNAVVTIVDNDTPGGKLNFASATFGTNEGAGTALITVARSGSSAGSLTVYATATNGTAISGSDFNGVTNMLSWADGDVSNKTFTVTLLDDGIVEPDETITLRLHTPTRNGLTNLATLGSLTNATLSIVNDDLRGAVAYSTANYLANENGGPAIITVVRPGGSAESISVNFAAFAATAVNGVDFLATNGTLSFGPGEVSKSFVVPILNNIDEEPFPRLISLALSNATPSGTLGSPSSALISIVDDELVNEPPGGLDTVFTPPFLDESVLALALQGDGKLIIGGEFTVPSRLTRLNKTNGSIDSTFQSSANGPVQCLLLQEDGRTLVGGSFGMINGVARNRFARIMNNGALDTSFNPGAGADNPVFALAETFINGDRKIILGGNFAHYDGGPRNGIARVNANGGLDLGFDPGTGVNGTVYAIAAYPTNSTHAGKVLIGGDFTLFNEVGRSGVARLNANGSLDLTFNPGTGALGVVRALAIQSDGRVLIGGSFTNFNGNALNRIARLNDNGTVDGTFNIGAGANDTVLSISVQGDTKIVLGGLFTRCNGVSRNRITRLNNDGTADPTINFGAGANDYVAATLVQPDGRIVLAGGFTQYDGIARQRIARIYGGSVAGSGTLEFTSALYQVDESQTNAVITVRRRGGTSGPTPGASLTVDARAINGTAINGVHYLGGTNVLVFAEAEVFQSFNIPLIADVEVNNDRTVNLTLSNIQPPGSAALGNQPTAVLSIVNDDCAISFERPSFSQTENAVDGQATISLIRIGSTASTATVNFTTTTNGTATPGVDFTHVTNLVTFGIGDSVRTVTIPIVNDALIEGPETVTMELTNAMGAYLLAPSSATLTIVNDDLGPGQIMLASLNYPAGESSGNAVVTLVRTNGSSGEVSVRIQTADLTASAGLDYVPQNNVSVPFGAGETNKTVLIPILDDGFVEGDEVFSVILTNFSGGATLLGTNQGVVTIVDNDMGFTLGSPIYVVDEAGPSVTLSVLRLGGSNGVASVRYDTTNGTATAGSDFTGIANGLLTFLNGEVLKTFTVSITDDTLVEGDEAFGVQLSNPTPGIQLLVSSAVVSVLDNDTGFSLGTNSYAIDEAGTNLVVTVYRTNANTGPVSVSLTTSNITAVAGADYTAVGMSLNFTNGEALKVILVPINNDTLVEGIETFEVSLSSPSGNAQLVGATSATASIIDNDAGLRFSSASYAVSETGVQATVTVLRENVLTNTVAVNYSTSDGTANNGVDYTGVSGLLVFTNGETSKSFDIQIIDDTLEEGAETILLSLSSPTGQVSIINPGAASLTIVDNDGGSILPAGALITAENVIANGAIDPGETVSMLIALRNASGVNTTNLVATLLATNGVASPSGPQNYGALINGGASVSRPFTFTANGTNGSTVFATLQVQEQSGGQSYGRATITFLLGSASGTYSNSLPINILDATNASPYPSTITVTGLVGTVSKVVVTVTNLSHPSPDDIDMLLGGPTGASTMLMSDAGGGTNITNVTLTFDDAAASFLPDSAQISSGTNKPTNYLLADLFPSPAPSSPWGSTLASFNGTDPNGLWSLYIVDDLSIFSGTITRGWSLRINTVATLPSATDLAVAMTAAPSSVVIGSNLVFSISVTNHGPWAATGVMLTNTLPAGTAFVSATPSAGSISLNGSNVVWTVGNLAKDAGAVATVVVKPTLIGPAISSSSALGAQGEPNPGNNTARTTNNVVAPTADLVVNVVDAPDPVYVGANNLTYTITVNNAGPATALGVGVTNVLPPEVSFVSASPADYTIAGNVVTFTNLGNLGNGSQLVATITARPLTPGTITMTTTVGSTLTDPLKGNNTVAVKTVVDLLQVGYIRSGNNLIISWPADATGYAVYRTTSLVAPIVWTEVLSPPSIIVGDQKVMTLPIGNGNEFFRLQATAP